MARGDIGHAEAPNVAVEQGKVLIPVSHAQLEEPISVSGQGSASLAWRAWVRCMEVWPGPPDLGIEWTCGWGAYPNRWLLSLHLGTTGDTMVSCHAGSVLAQVTGADVGNTKALEDETSRKTNCGLSPSKAHHKLITKPHILVYNCHEPSN